MADSGDIARMERILTRVEKAGVKVREMDGWRSRGRTFERVPVGLIDHHDASTPRHGEWGFLNATVNGRGGASPVPGPLSQFHVARCLSVPQIAVCAAGRANHAGRGGPYGPVPQDEGSSWLYGIEKSHGGVSDEPMTEDFHYATDALYAAIIAECRLPRLLIGHKEWARPLGRKIDPLYSMDWRRKRVANFRPRPIANYGTVTMSLPVLGLGSEGPMVGHVQRALGITADGKFGPATLQAVGDFHVKQGWRRGDQVGGDTYKALGFGVKV